MLQTSSNGVSATVETQPVRTEMNGGELDRADAATHLPPSSGPAARSSQIRDVVCLALLAGSTPVFPVAGSLGPGGMHDPRYLIPLIAALLAGCLCAAALRALRPRLRGRRGTRIPEALVLAPYVLAAGAFLIGGDGLPLGVLTALGIVTGLAAVAAFGLACQAFARPRLGDNLALVGSAIMADELAAQLCQALGDPWLRALRVAALLAGAVLLGSIARHAPRPEDARAPEKPLTTLAALASLLAIPLLGVFMYALMFRPGLGTAAADTGRPALLGMDAELLAYLASSALLVALGCTRQRHPLYATVYKTAAPIGIILILVMQSLPSDNPLRAYEGFLFSFLTSFIVQFALCVVLTLLRSEDGVRGGGAAVLAFLASYAVGRCCDFVFYGFDPSLDGERATHQVVLALVLSLMLVLVLLQYRAASATPERAAQTDHPSVGALIETTCARLASEHGLTPREQEVFVMLARGYAPAYIAETFIVSDSTVRSHVKSIYHKMGVSSREELIVLVDRSA